MKVSGGGFEQCFNAQVLVDTGSLLVVVADITQAANDKQQVAPMLEKLDALPEALGSPATLLADNGYFSAANVETCRDANSEPLIAAGREDHHAPWQTRLTEPAPLAAGATRVEEMKHRLKTCAGRAAYALR